MNTPFNSAQSFLLRLGFDPALLLLHLKGRNASSRKKGPGRKHQQGRK